MEKGLEGCALKTKGIVNLPWEDNGKVQFETLSWREEEPKKKQNANPKE